MNMCEQINKTNASSNTFSYLKSFGSMHIKKYYIHKFYQPCLLRHDAKRLYKNVDIGNSVGIH